LIEKLKVQLTKLSILGEIQKYVGIDIKRDRPNRKLTLTQSQHIKKYVNKEVPDNATPKLIPMPSSIDYNVKNDKDIVNKTINSEIGRIRYLADHTRPDILAAAGILGSHVENPHDNHLKGLRYLSRYLKGTPTVGLTLGGKKEIILFGFCDASFIKALKSKSRLAYTFFLSPDSGTICARSVNDTTVSLHSTESEVKALCLTTIETIWLRGFLKELGFEQTEPTIIYVDNAATKYLAEALDNVSNNVAHLVVKINFIQEQVANGNIAIKYINTENQVADILTKPLPQKQFTYLRKYLLDGFDNQPISEIMLRKRKRQR
jgi:hypothetical protein